MHHVSREFQRCIDECLRCYQTCFGMAMNHCLESGGEHVEPKHFRIMMACAEILPDVGSFHADELRACQAPLPGMRGDLRPVRRGMRARRRHAGLRRPVPPLR